MVSGAAKGWLAAKLVPDLLAVLHLRLALPDTRSTKGPRRFRSSHAYGIASLSGGRHDTYPIAMHPSNCDAPIKFCRIQACFAKCTMNSHTVRLVRLCGAYAYDTSNNVLALVSMCKQRGGQLGVVHAPCWKTLACSGLRKCVAWKMFSVANTQNSLL